MGGTKMIISFDDFSKVDIRVGTITNVEDFPQAKKPAYKLIIDFGTEIGIKKSSAQITVYYDKTDLIGKQVLCVVNFPPKQIGPVISEVLCLGVPDAKGNIILAIPEKKAPNGSKLC
jgi:tRNA-binding protein